MNKEQQRSLKRIYTLMGKIYEELGKLVETDCNSGDSIKMNNIPTSITLPEEQILNLLHEFKIPPNILGYKYIGDALLFLFENDENANISITRELYPAIAQKYNKTNPSQIERAIRHGIEHAFKNNSARLRELFPTQTQLGKNATNSEFLYRILEYIKKGI